MRTPEYKLSSAEQEIIAQRLYEAEKETSYIPLLTEAYPEMTQDDAYAIQSAGLKMRLAEGKQVVGHKIGITSLGMMKLLNVDTPDYGYLLNSGMLLEGEPCRRSDMNIPIVEGEIAFLMGRDLTGPVTPADILEAAQYVVPCFEICDARFQSWTVTVRDTISDDAGASKFLIGSSPKTVQDINLRNIGMVIEKNGRLYGTGAGAEVLGNPVNSMTWLVNKLAEYGIGLKKGEIVLSGAFLAADPAQADDVYTLSVDGFPSLTLRFE